MSFLKLPSDLHIALLLEWLPCKVLSTLDVALSERRYWLELLRSPVLVVDPPLPLAIAPDRSYYTWLEGRQLKVATLRVNKATLSAIKAMRFAAVKSLVAHVLAGVQEIRDLADLLEKHRSISNLSIQSNSYLGQGELLALAKHKLDLKVLDLRGSPIDRNSQSVAGGIFAVLYQFGCKLEELRLTFGHRGSQSDALKAHYPDIMTAIAQHCRRLTKLELEGCLIPIEAIHMLCDSNRNITELRCCVEVTAAEAASACQEVLDRLPRLDHLSLKGSHKTHLPTLAGYPNLQSIVTDEGCAYLVIRGGSITIESWATAARALEILMALPKALRSISCSYQPFSAADILQIAQKHGAELETIREIWMQTLSAAEWQQLWATCPRLLLINNGSMELNLSRHDRYFEFDTLTAREAIDILLTVPVPLRGIFVETDAIRLASADVLAVAAKHGATLNQCEMRLHAGELGFAGLENFLQLCPELQCMYLSHADAAFLELVTKHCTRTLTKLTVRDGQQRVTDAAITSVLQGHSQLTDLTLLDCTRVTSAVLDHIANLTALRIYGDSGINKFDLVEALNAGKLSNLTKLCLNWSEEQLLYIKTIFQLAYKDKPSILQPYHKYN